VDRLVVEGGATRLLVADLPDMSLFPDAANGDSKSPDQVAAYRKLAVMHNDRLRAKLGRFRNNHIGGDIDIRLLPVAATMHGPVRRRKGVLEGRSRLGRPVLSRIFWDEWHPLTWNHKKVADADAAER
jgi:phospholipase/lecithinase/hemolysin